MTPPTPKPEATTYLVLEQTDDSHPDWVEVDMTDDPIHYHAAEQLRFRIPNDPQGGVWRVEAERLLTVDDQKPPGYEFKRKSQTVWRIGVDVGGFIEPSDELVMNYRAPAHLVPVSSAPTFNQPQPESVILTMTCKHGQGLDTCDICCPHEPAPLPQQSDPVTAATTKKTFSEKIAALSDMEVIHAMKAFGVRMSVAAFRATASRPEPEPPHASDCAVHNGPAYPSGLCDCKPPSPAPAGPTPPHCLNCKRPMTEERPGLWTCWTCDQDDGVKLAAALRQRDEARKEVEDSKKALEYEKLSYVAMVSHLQGPHGYQIDEPGAYQFLIRIFDDDSGFVISTRKSEPGEIYPCKEWREFQSLMDDLSSLQSQATRDAEEIKRLKAELDKWDKDYDETAEEKCDAESERDELIVKLSTTEGECARLKEQVEAQVRFIEDAQVNNVRLKSERDVAAARVAECEKALKEIEAGTDAPDIDVGGEMQFGLHCGVEDRNCQDRYEGANYGWASGVERTLEWAANCAKSALLTAPTRTEGKA